MKIIKTNSNINLIQMNAILLIMKKWMELVIHIAMTIVTQS